MIGRKARLAVALRRWLPGDLFERIYFGTVMRRVTQLAQPRNTKGTSVRTRENAGDG